MELFPLQKGCENDSCGYKKSKFSCQKVFRYCQATLDPFLRMASVVLKKSTNILSHQGFSPQFARLQDGLLLVRNGVINPINGLIKLYIKL